MLPKISIVTPNYNQGKYIEETILSVINQNYPNLEYVIIDGGSTDESVAIIKKYEKHLKYWVSEPDLGQADAINKGLLHCTGNIFNWINSDDLLATNALNTISKLYKPRITIAGKVFNFYQDNPELNDYTQNSNLTFNAFLTLQSTYHQPGIWVDLLGIKSIKLIIDSHYYFDFFFYLTYLRQFEQVVYTDNVLANFRVHAQSKTSLIQEKSKVEIVNFYQEMYTYEHQPNKEKIKKILKYWEAIEKIECFYNSNTQYKSSTSLIKFVALNAKYLSVNIFWKFVLKYIINFKNARKRFVR